MNPNTADPDTSGTEYGPNPADPGGAPRIAFIAEDLCLPLDEGARKASFQLISFFSQRRTQVFVFTSHAIPELKNTFPLPGNKFLISRQLLRTLRDLAPDFILYIPASSGTLGAFIRAAALKIQSGGKPLALVSLQYRRLPAMARFLGLGRWADFVFTQSQASRQVFHALGCKTILLPGGVDQSIFHPVEKSEQAHLRSKYGFQAADRIVMHVGHCKQERNVSILARLAQAGFKAVLIASTSTPIDLGLLAGLRRAGVTVITDYIDPIQHYYQMADVYLFPVSQSTSAIDAPLSVLEAMACNIPIVTTRFGALPGLFAGGKGFYYAESEEDMLRLVKEAAGEQECATAAQVSAFSWDNVAAKILVAMQKRGTL